MAATETTQDAAASINYRNSLPGAPRPLCQSPDEPLSPTTLYNAMQPQSKSPDVAPTLPPALPRRSILRTSKMLDAMQLRLDGKSPDEPPSASRAPHELYLSSEEDASSSAGDFSDYGSDSEAEGESSQQPSRKRSHEDIARAVEVVFAGKPTVVTVRRGSSARNDVARSSAFPLPPRASTVAATERAPQRQSTQPTFLNTDPFRENPRASVLQKTIGLVRKRSRPFLNMSNTSQPQLGNNASNMSTASLASPSIAGTDPGDCEPPAPLASRGRAPSMPPIRTQSPGPMTYQDIMRNIKRNEAASPRSPVAGSPVLPPEKKSRMLGGLSISKRRSVRT